MHTPRTTVWNEAEEKRISFRLVFSMPEKYPYVMPAISIESPRGMSQRQIGEMLQDLSPRIENLLGSEMMYEIIELFKVQHSAHGCPHCCDSFLGVCQNYSEEGIFF
jgi:hypothetical protein